MTGKALYSDKLVRDVLAALKNAEFFYRADFDPHSVSLDEVISPPDSNSGLRIYTITEGPGKHQSEESMVPGKRIPGPVYDVDEGEVYVTLNTIETLAGENSTYYFQRQEDNTLKVTGRVCHIRS